MAKPRAASTAQAKGQAPKVQALRFVASAHEHREQIHSQSFTLNAGQQVVNPANVPIPAYGFITAVLLDVSWTGGTGGTLAADGPFNFFGQVSIQDVNGAYLQNPIDGYALLQENIYGGYAYRQDPRLSPLYTSTPTAGRFLIRVPVQVSRHNGYGALANQNAAAPYLLSYTVSPNTTVFTGTQPSVQPTWTVTSWLESWTQPNARDLRGRPQAQLPPLHGSTQQWSVYTKAIAAGNNVTQLPRVGNTIRSIVVISRDNSGVRSDAVFPDPFSLNLDSRVLTAESAAVRRHLQAEGLAATTTRDVGVHVFYFNNSIIGHIGDESSDLWLPSVQSTRLELVGSSASVGNLQIVTNDIVQVEVDQAARYVLESQTGDLQHPTLDG